MRRVGFASALLPYGHWVVLVWGRVAGTTTTWTRSSNRNFCVWSWILRLGDQPWSRGVKIKDGLCFVENRVQGLHNPRGNWEGGMSTPGSCSCLHLNPHTHSHPALTNSPMHFCSFKLWGTILGMGAQLQQEDCYDFDKVTEKIFPNWNKRLEKLVFSHLLYITIFLYYLSE